MRTITQEKTYGIETGSHKGQEQFFIICDGKKKDICFTDAGLAMRQAERYIKGVFKSFMRTDNVFVVFSFKQMGLFNSYKKRAQVRINLREYQLASSN